MSMRRACFDEEEDPFGSDQQEVDLEAISQAAERSGVSKSTESEEPQAAEPVEYGTRAEAAKRRGANKDKRKAASRGSKWNAKVACRSLLKGMAEHPVLDHGSGTGSAHPWHAIDASHDIRVVSGVVVCVRCGGWSVSKRSFKLRHPCVASIRPGTITAFRRSMRGTKPVQPPTQVRRRGRGAAKRTAIGDIVGIGVPKKRVCVTCLAVVKERAGGDSSAGASTGKQDSEPKACGAQRGADSSQQQGDAPTAIPSPAAPMATAACGVERAGLAGSARTRSCKYKMARDRSTASDAKCGRTRAGRTEEQRGAGEPTSASAAPAGKRMRGRGTVSADTSLAGEQRVDPTSAACERNDCIPPENAGDAAGMAKRRLS
jgi:hypothetical protein